jgi:hypothetical protein
MSDAASVQILTDPVLQTTCIKCRCTMETAGLTAFSPIVCPQCGHEMQVPARLGHFLLMYLIGTGGMGGVYWAHDQVLNRDVAIKVMLKTLGDDPKFVETFLREAQAAARINHPHIAQIYSFGQEKGQPYIVMELVPGGGLDRLMAITPQLDQALVMRVGAEVADGLKRASEEGLIHGDIKPENILIGEGGQAKLVDFGIATMVGGKSNEIWGTPYYIAPEKVRRQKSDHRADIYSLGGTLYHALAGVPPFDGSDAMAVVKARFAGPPVPLATLRKDIDPAVTAIIDRMLYAEPARRYPTYDSLLSDMRHYVERAGPGQIAAASKKVVVLKRKGLGATTGHLPGSATGKVVGTSTTTLTITPPSVPGRITLPGGTPGRPKGIVLQKGSLADAVRSGALSAGNTGDVLLAEQRSRNWLTIILVTVGLLVLAAVGTIGGLLWAKTVQKNKAQTAASQAQDARQAARSAILVSVTNAQALPAAMTARAAKGVTLVEEASKMVTDVLGADAAASLIPPRPAAAVDTNAPPAAVEANAPPPAGEGTTQLPPLVVSVRAMYLDLYALQDAANWVNLQAAGIVEAARAADDATNSLAMLQEMAADLQRRVSVMENDPSLVQAENGLKKLTAARDGVRRLAENAQAEQQRREEERKRLEAEKLAKAAAERQEAERVAAIAAEVARVQACEAENVALLHKFEFREARHALGALMDGIKSAEGRKAMALAQERIERLAELHAFLAVRVVGFKHPTDGWTVQASDARSLTVNGKEVAWADVGDVRMVLFIRTFLAEDHQARDLKLRERVRQSLNGALYCTTFVKESAPVRELAGKLVAKAMELFPDAKADAQRIMPDLIKE